MKKIALIIVLVACATVFSVSKVAAASAARLRYDSQTPKSVNVVYMNMPQASTLRYVNATSGKVYAPQSLKISGNGTYSIPKGTLPAGEYYILARNSQNQYLAQTVHFYISRGDSGPQL